MQDRLLADLLRERKLHEDAVDFFIGIQLCDEFEQLCLGGFFGERILIGFEAAFCAVLLLVRYIHAGSGVVADQHDCESGISALCAELFDLCADFRFHICGDFLAVNDLCHCLFLLI